MSNTLLDMYKGIKCQFIIIIIILLKCVVIGLLMWNYTDILKSVKIYRHSITLPVTNQTNNTSGVNGTSSIISKIGYTIQKAFQEGSVVKPKSAKTYKILYWTGAYTGPMWYGIGSEPFKKCRYNNCVATNSKAEYNTSDAMLFIMAFIKAFPKYRFPSQKWVMVWQESIINSGNYGIYNGLFNVTMTYAKKSDIFLPYSGVYFVKRATPLNNQQNFAKGRKKLVAWFNSNCGGQSKRYAYVKHLKKYINVDIYGGCGPQRCPRGSKHCDLMLSRDYKFYLAFENSLCIDYITEKIWRAIDNNIIPVVLGGANYSDFLPPHSFIDVKDFDSPKLLADHLLMLDKDDTKYNSYFEWKSLYTIAKRGPVTCALCEYMNKYGNVTKVYDRMDLFWNGDTDCYSPEVYYKNMDTSIWTN